MNVRTKPGASRKAGHPNKERKYTRNTTLNSLAVVLKNYQALTCPAKAVSNIIARPFLCSRSIEEALGRCIVSSQYGRLEEGGRGGGRGLGMNAVKGREKTCVSFFCDCVSLASLRGVSSPLLALAGCCFVCAIACNQRGMAAAPGC